MWGRGGRVLHALAASPAAIRADTTLASAHRRALTAALQVIGARLTALLRLVELPNKIRSCFCPTTTTTATKVCGGAATNSKTNRCPSVVQAKGLIQRVLGPTGG